MEYFTNIVRATRSAMISAHTEFQREMYSSTPNAQTVSSATTDTQTPSSNTQQNTPSTSNTIVKPSTLPTITPTELAHLRKSVYDNTISLKK